ncbi:glycerol kinase [Fragilariopsis cylindrus CCMP1102]|uniref:glycerol kinase n=1 Tax=Fragilariopsis cylindrus CCMP1102 TaxID=635003 RepID=A0A1E7F9D7_9STRA|nr:glycerol kinase [Fragilariopsis cylindrus CCMP1102]|eukprot:OEU14625.1 glycerol kinase [Fragilariopsis cylindrus CCMP1102]
MTTSSIPSKFECKTSVNAEALIAAGATECGSSSSSVSPAIPLIGSIDQGTSSTRFLVFTQLGQIAASAQMEHTQIFPTDHIGWHEHNPIEIWYNTLTCIQNVAQALKNSKFSIDLKSQPLQAIGITNQRETTIAWNTITGVPYQNAIVWDDLRTTDVAHTIANGDPNRLRSETGLPIASYFAGTKVRWLIDNNPELRADLLNTERRSQVRFGTIDTWLIYQLTGSKAEGRATTAAAANIGGLFITDVTNASRWLFMDLHTLKWDKVLIDTVCGHDGSLSDDGVSIPLSALPDIKSSSEVYGRCATGFGEPAIEGTPIAGILGDQQAALFGQGAFEPGEAKNTYGTGLFLMMNTGTQPTPSTHGLLTTVGYCLGNEKPVYALEGSVSHSGSTIQWLRDQLQIIDDASESEIYARKVDSNDGMYFVPAFAGLFAPYWKSDARACIVGMTASHNKNHFCRAALESAAYQTKDVFDAINVDSHVPLKELRVDGGGTANSLLMQFTADMTNVPVIKPVVKETTALGAAYVAGLAVGVWKDTKEIKSLWAEEERFVPSMDSKLREKYLKGWKKAIQKSMGWVDGDDQID